MKVLIVDDHQLVRRGLGYVLGECFSGAQVKEAGSAEEALDVMREEPVDVALIDIRMPGRNGLELLKDIKQEWPDVPVIMLSTFEHGEYVRTALSEGASGYLLKDATLDDLGDAIRAALAGGGNVLAAGAIRTLFDESPPEEEGQDGPEPTGNLTPREVEIIRLLAEGRSNSQISRHLHLSEKTVKAHLAAVFRKLGVTNRTQAAMAAVRMGLGPAAGSARSGPPVPQPSRSRLGEG